MKRIFRRAIFGIRIGQLLEYIPGIGSVFADDIAQANFSINPSFAGFSAVSLLLAIFRIPE